MHRTLDFSISVILLIIPVLLMAMTFSDQFDVPSFGGDVGPAFAPRAYFIVWFALAISACVTAYRTDGGTTPDQATSIHKTQLFGTIAVAFGTAIAMINIGFVFATIPGFFLFCLAFGYRNYLVLCLMSFAAPLIIWATFTYAFELLLPRSPWLNFM